MGLNEKTPNENDLNKSIPNDKKVGRLERNIKNSAISQKKNDNSDTNDTSIPFLIEGDDEIQPVINSDSTAQESKINDNSTFHNKIDRIPKKDRIPSNIRDDDNPADVGQ
jgi:hypothetical protein